MPQNNNPLGFVLQPGFQQGMGLLAGFGPGGAAQLGNSAFRQQQAQKADEERQRLLARQQSSQDAMNAAINAPDGPFAKLPPQMRSLLATNPKLAQSVMSKLAGRQLDSLYPQAMTPLQQAQLEGQKLTNQDRRQTLGLSKEQRSAAQEYLGSIEGVTPQQARYLSSNPKAMTEFLKTQMKGAQGPFKDLSQKITSTQKLRKEWTARSARFIDQKASISTVKTTLAQANSSGDIAAIISFNKLIDPGSRVTDQDFENVKKTRGILERIGITGDAADAFIEGRTLTPTQRSDMAATADAIFAKAIDAQRRNREVFESVFNPLGLDLTEIMPDFGSVEAPREDNPKLDLPPGVTPIGQKEVKGKMFIKGSDGGWYATGN